MLAPDVLASCANHALRNEQRRQTVVMPLISSTEVTTAIHNWLGNALFHEVISEKLYASNLSNNFLISTYEDERIGRN